MDRRQLQEMEKRNERQMRLVQAVVGAVGGAGIGLVIDMQLMRHWYSTHASGAALVIVIVIGAVLGGVAGYFGNTWQGAVDR